MFEHKYAVFKPKKVFEQMKKIKIPNLAALDLVAKELLDLFGSHRVIAFYGSMGAGKTTLIRHLCKELGVTQTVNSPSFAIVNQYQGNGENELVNHFDFYRIKSQEEAYDFGYQEYFFGGHYCFIEWPEMVQELLPEDCFKLIINVISPTEREIEILSPTNKSTEQN